jgi:hypothetical protein
MAAFGVYSESLFILNLYGASLTFRVDYHNCKDTILTHGGVLAHMALLIVIKVMLKA